MARQPIGERPWEARAACRGLYGLMFPVDKAGEERAKQVCASCPVKEPCLDWALALREEHGVYGGLSEDERVLIRRNRF